MPKFRRKISAPRRDFLAELKRLERFDATNQARFSAQPGTLTKHQLHLLTEAIFFRAFRAYESFVRDVFLLYCLGKRPRSGAKVTPYLAPRTFLHAEELVQSSMKFLDWTNPEIMIERADVFLQDGFPVKLSYTTQRESLHDLRRIRNRIAHSSKESLAQYQVALRRHYTTVPLSVPSPGEFLLVLDKKQPKKYKLLVFLGVMRKLCEELT